MICGTRGSQLAQAQAQLVIDELKRLQPEVSITRRIVKTSGDVFRKRSIVELGGFGAFVREIDDLLLAGEIDFAVHSLKDVPTEPRRGIEVAAVLKRGDPRDFLVSEVPFGRLPAGALVGTSSLRRSMQVLRKRQDLKTVPLRGNVPTRLSKVSAGELDAAVVAKAGLDRLGVVARGFPLSLKDFVPAPAQGAIAVVARKGSDAASIVRCLDHRSTRLATDTERSIMRLLGGGCTAPVGVYARCASGRIDISAMVLSIHGDRSVVHEASIPQTRWAQGAKEFAAALRRMGGGDLVKEAARATLKG